VNGRVRDVPNERLVRWYVTVGLVDPPLSRRGRVAQYGRRHLLQLVAVKRRQAEGRSLAEIQAELAGATDEKLAAVARVPGTLPAPEAPAVPGRFWARQAGRAERPAAERAGRPVAAAHGGPADRDAVVPPEGLADRGAVVAPGGLADRGAVVLPGGLADRGAVVAPGGLVRGIRLAPGVTLLLDGAGREPGPDDVPEILNAAGPLLEELSRRRLCGDHLE
jgi:DNA-binding transcriptional MerR regulator